jgi:hypothetical protein
MKAFTLFTFACALVATTAMPISVDESAMAPAVEADHVYGTMWNKNENGEWIAQEVDIAELRTADYARAAELGPNQQILEDAVPLAVLADGTVVQSVITSRDA